MHDAPRVRRIKRIGDLDREIEQPVDRKGFASDLLLQCPPLEQLEHEERTTVVIADFVDRADVRVIERRGGACFAEESVDRCAIGLVLGGEQLQGDLSAQDEVFSDVDVAHPAASQLVEHAIMRKSLAHHRGIFGTWRAKE